MGDFRLGPISQYEPYREDQPSHPPGGKREKRRKTPAYNEDGVDLDGDQVAFTAETGGAPVEAEVEGEAEPQDYYTPSEQPEE